MAKKLLMISTDRLIFEEGSNVRVRQIEYAKNWDEVHIIVLDVQSVPKKAQTNPAEISIAPNVWVYSSRSSGKIRAPFDAIRLGSFIVERRGVTDITCQDPFLAGMAGVGLKKRFPNVALELQLHTDISSPYFVAHSLSNRVRKVLAMNYLPKADSVRVVSERIKDYLVNAVGLDAAKIKVQPIRVETDFIKNAPLTIDLHKKYPQFGKVVLMASRFEKEKNFELALEAFRLVSQKMPKVGLVIVGSGSFEGTITSWIKKFGMGLNVVVESWVTKETLASYYKSADLFLSTSLYEGYGMTFVEAKAAGLPIVSTDVGVAREMGATIAEFSAEDVAAKIEGILSQQ